MADEANPVVTDQETILALGGGSSDETLTIGFEFAGGGDQAVAMPRDGHVIAVQASAAAVQVSIDTPKLPQSPNGGVTRIVNGFIWNNGLVQTTSNYFPVRARFLSGQYLKVSVTAATYVQIVVAFPAT